MFRKWGAQFRQLHPKPFQGVVSRLQLEGLSIGRLVTNCTVEIVGEKPRDSLAFGLVLHQQDSSHFAHGTPLNTNCLFGFDPQREANLVSSAAGLSVVLVEVNKSLLQLFANQLGHHELDDAFFRQNIVTAWPTHIDAYSSYLRQVIFLMDHHPQILQSPDLLRLIQGDLLPLLCNALSQPQQAPRPLRRAEIVAQAQDYMIANLHRPMTLAELSIAVHASRRSLIYGFQDIFGMGPMAYLKQQRLNGVRQALLAADPEHATVANIAHAWGFYSLGHFAHEYRCLFSEAPSATLRHTT
ncbi:helix-turn-helix domain-containing protein [Halomicronema sp. CCY15110]|uniref:helix-turn-helix domain-containing protein n=1 Tax=Halomicronema sp. CCY15110 TaxID=2767773 RepID=UPI00194F0F81|nr:helix-turn-helix domain-containing protein [Halomicronema sp. CCY15110]